jgi:hypothetical protein
MILNVLLIFNILYYWMKLWDLVNRLQAIKSIIWGVIARCFMNNTLSRSSLHVMTRITEERSSGLILIIIALDIHELCDDFFKWISPLF